MIIYFFIAVVICFAATAILARFLIPVLKSLKIGQKIREIGPRWHKSKEGTPMMGGIFFIIPVTLVLLVYAFVRVKFSEHGLRFLFSVIFALCCGAIGFADDAVKLFKKRNEGLNPSEKMLLQIIVAALYLFAMGKWGALSTTLRIPFIGATAELGNFYYIIALILIVGVVNSVNLTDGIDGLASCVTVAVAAFFAVCAVSVHSEGALYMAGAVFGGCFGFLIYNFHPAKIFMGDTGSLYLGGAVCAMAFMINDPLIILSAGIVYIAEAVSVILQVSYFKLTHGKRLFKMSPLHHHFERCGWSENKIVAVFTLVTAVMCIVSYIFR